MSGDKCYRKLGSLGKIGRVPPWPVGGIDPKLFDLDLCRVVSRVEGGLGFARILRAGIIPDGSHSLWPGTVTKVEADVRRYLVEHLAKSMTHRHVLACLHPFTRS